MRVVFDTNVFIAAALKGGLIKNILEFAETSTLVTLITSEEILIELKQKLISKFDKSEENVNFFINKIKNISEIVEVEKNLEIITRDLDDNKILECALAGQADLIISSDQDLISLKNFQGIGIIHPKTLTWTFPEYFKKIKKNQQKLD